MQCNVNTGSEVVVSDAKTKTDISFRVHFSFLTFMVILASAEKYGSSAWLASSLEAAACAACPLPQGTAQQQQRVIALALALTLTFSVGCVGARSELWAMSSRWSIAALGAQLHLFSPSDCQYHCQSSCHKLIYKWSHLGATECPFVHQTVSVCVCVW